MVLDVRGPNKILAEAKVEADIRVKDLKEDDVTCNAICVTPTHAASKPPRHHQ